MNCVAETEWRLPMIPRAVMGETFGERHASVCRDKNEVLAHAASLAGLISGWVESSRQDIQDIQDIQDRTEI